MPKKRLKTNEAGSHGSTIILIVSMLKKGGAAGKKLNYRLLGEHDKVRVWRGRDGAGRGSGCW